MPFQSPPLLHTTQAAYFVNRVQERPQFLGEAPSAPRHLNRMGEAILQPHAHARQPEGAGRRPLCAGPRRQPAAREWRLLRRRWLLAVPSPRRCYSQAPALAQPGFSIPLHFCLLPASGWSLLTCADCRGGSLNSSPGNARRWASVPADPRARVSAISR